MKDLFGLAWRKFVRTPKGRLLLAALLFLSFVLAFESRGKSGAAGVLSFGAFLLPLLSYALLTRVVGDRGLSERTSELSDMGASRPKAAWAHLGFASLASAAVCGVMGTLFVLVAHRASDPPLGPDLLSTAWTCALGGCVYSALFAFGSTFRKGAGTSVVLGLDWLFGGGGGLSLLFPRSHVHSLLGGPNAGPFVPRASALVLVILFGLLSLATIARASRAR